MLKVSFEGKYVRHIYTQVFEHYECLRQWTELTLNNRKEKGYL